MRELPPIPFDHYLTWDETTGFLDEAAAAFGELVSVDAIGQTPEGRQLWCAQITAPCDDPSAKPAYLVQAVVHAQEVAGTTAALHLVKHLLEGWERDAGIRRLLEDVVFYVVPRMNPDGAEFTLRTGGSIRSRNAPRVRRNGLVQGDVNGDGLILWMRKEDPCGNLREHPQDGRLLSPREAGDGAGPFYFAYPEGFVQDWDGGPVVHAERSADFNRNWGANWRPEYEQGGAGDFPFSQPEMRALAEFIYAHPNIFGILGYHCGCNSVLRPPSSGSDDDILPADLEKMREIGLRGEDITGFRLRAVVDYRLDKSKPIALRGHFHDWGYRHLGLFVYEIELGNIYNSRGVTTEQYFASDDEERREYDLLALQWHDENPQKGAYIDWQPFDHPQLGRVEIGGWRRHFLANPLSEDMATIAPRCTEFVLDHARRHPRLVITKVSVEPIEGRIYRLRATVMNTGDLPTQITELGHRIVQNEPVRVEIRGAEVLSRGGVAELGQLAGISGYRDLEWFVRARPGDIVQISACAPKAVDSRAVVTIPEGTV